MIVYRRDYSREVDSIGVKVIFVGCIGTLRKSPEDLPDTPRPVDQYERLKVERYERYERANKIYTAARRPIDKQVQSYKNIAAMQWK